MKTFHDQWEALQRELGGILTAHYHRGIMARREAIARAVQALQELDATEPHQPPPAFRENDCGGVFDGFRVTSDADPGL